MKKIFALSVALVSLGLALPFHLFAAEAKSDADQTDSDYYWKGTQLYNLGRLGEAFESFEKAIQRKQNSKEAEAYLLQIRQEIVNNAKKHSEVQGSLNYGGGSSPETALNVVYVQKGYIRVTIQAKFLFDENTAALKSGAMDVIKRLADILDSKEGQRVEVTLINEIETIVNARDIDAERTLLVFALLNFERFSSETKPS